MRIATIGVILGLFLSASRADTPAPQSPTHIVTLDTGETLKATLVSQTADHVVLSHPVLGTLTLPAARVLSLSEIPSDAASTAPVAPAPAAPVAPAPAAPAAPAEPAPVTPEPEAEEAAKWSGKVEAGLNGSEGNTEQMSLRFGASVERATSADVFTARATYRLETESGDATKNELLLMERFEWLLPKSRWSVFVESNQEYNEFRDYDFRVDGLFGAGYRFIDEEKTKLTGRVGVGAAKEFGGSSDDIFPIALASLDFTHQLTENVQFNAYGEYKPDVSDFGNYQLLGRASVDVALNESKSMLLKLGVEDRYDNDSGTARQNDLDYFAMIVYAF